jgi:hypothetical protein
MMVPTWFSQFCRDALYSLIALWKQGPVSQFCRDALYSLIVLWKQGPVRPVSQLELTEGFYAKIQ